MKALWKKCVHFLGQSYNSKKLTVKGILLFTLLGWSLSVVVLFSENISEACTVENSSGVACTIGRVVPGTIESSGTFTIAAGVVGSSGHLNSCETINRSLLQNRCVNMNHCHPNKYIQSPAIPTPPAAKGSKIIEKRHSLQEERLKSQHVFLHWGLTIPKAWISFYFCTTLT